MRLAAARWPVHSHLHLARPLHLRSPLVGRAGVQATTVPMAHNMEDGWDVAGKTVVITGATNGIGKEAARQLAARGAVVVLACRNVSAAERVADEIQQQHRGSQVVVGPRLDLSSQESVRQFAEQYEAQGRPLHVLINNAGANHHGKPWYTPEGFGGQTMTNYLGPFLLTRLLEQRLQRSAPSRVLNLSSVTHRYAHVGRPEVYPKRWCVYPSTKLANALFAIELQRRLQGTGVSSCAIDPGGVASNIWSSAKLSSEGLVAYIIQNLYAPPSDGATAVVHAATVPWSTDAAQAAAVNASWAALEERPVRGLLAGGSKVSRASQLRGGSKGPLDFRFYARGMFASPIITSWRGVPNRTTADRARNILWGLPTLVLSLIDWPLRNLSGGAINTTTRPVPASPLVYDRELAARLWDASSDALGLPRAPMLLQRTAVAARVQRDDSAQEG